ncbi:hypothetical protein GCM10023169_06180 [Georgenia halophila]|uniref:DUF2470 domain-containing protein n=1 Tax=Georgenia halophila TaxID=620889 RepID=A0ABP8KVI6_9MICO
MSSMPHITPDARWIADVRDEGRGVLISGRPEVGLVTMSVWRDNVCVATVRLAPDQAADAVGALADGLVSVGAAPAAPSSRRVSVPGRPSRGRAEPPRAAPA